MQCLKFTYIILILKIAVALATACTPIEDTSSSPGISNTTIRLGSVLALEGQEEALGSHMKAGLEAAFSNQNVGKRKIELIFKNDYYEPPTARQSTQDVIAEDVFFVIGNVGTPTANVTLPILKEHQIPAVGFFTGARILRSGDRLIVNYRASYDREIFATVDLFLKSGLNPQEICAYVQNDSYGMAGLSGLKQAIEILEAPPDTIAAYDRVLNRTGEVPDRNNIGPVGVYTRNTPYVTAGYKSLKHWEEETGNRCRLVVTAGSYSNVARFAKVSREHQETWIISALSFTGADEFRLDLEEYDATENIVMTQVVPLLDSDLPIVREAKTKLGDEFGYVSLEGYILGRMTLKILNDIPGPLTRETFIEEVERSKFNLGGIEIDFTREIEPGANLVIVSYLTESGFQELDETRAEDWIW